MSTRHRTPLKVICSASTKVVQQTVPEFDYIKFAETVNGRCAMQGFIWGSVKEAITHESIMQQVLTKTVDGGMDINSMGVLQFSAVVALVTLGTVFTSVLNPDKATEYSNETFTNNAEMANARLAMIGFLILSMVHFQ
jgi:hypothetical protein